MKLTQGAVLRLVMLMSHYRSPLNFSTKRMAEAETILNRWIKTAVPCNKAPPVEFIVALSTDLNTLEAIALLHRYRKENKGEDLFAAMKFLGFFGDACYISEVKTLPVDQAQDLNPTYRS
jgi:cysteinyl-tRNA synthetase